ncbi:MAG: acetyl-CoA carboxylase carboxyltransferase subunit alpha [Terriglobia bacterium]
MAKFAFDFERPVVELEARLDELRQSPLAARPDIALEIQHLDREVQKLRKRVYSNLSPWQKVQMARHPERPRTLDYVRLIFSDFTEIRGDRSFRDDPAVVGGLGYLDHQSVVVVGHQKGRTAKANVERNFGMPHPEGYRKALRLVKLAEKFDLPVVSFVDTPGAFPGVGAEERGQAQAIATTIMEMSRVRTPIIVAVIGEGGSGGALALAVGDRIAMLEHSYYSVISPEGCASILWQNRSRTQDAAKALKMTAQDLDEFGVVDAVIPEPLGGAHRDLESVAFRLRKTLMEAVAQVKKIPLNVLLDERYHRFRNVGVFEEAPPATPAPKPGRNKKR